MMEIKLINLVGDFAENKDLAKNIRITNIIPALKNSQEVTIDFNGVNSATQSFIHALISEVIRTFGPNVIDKIYFKNCNKKVQTIISIVIDYVQDSIFEVNYNTHGLNER